MVRNSSTGTQMESVGDPPLTMEISHSLSLPGEVVFETQFEFKQ